MFMARLVRALAFLGLLDGGGSLITPRLGSGGHRRCNIAPRRAKCIFSGLSKAARRRSHNPHGAFIGWAKKFIKKQAAA